MTKTSMGLAISPYDDLLVTLLSADIAITCGLHGGRLSDYFFRRLQLHMRFLSLSIFYFSLSVLCVGLPIGLAEEGERLYTEKQCPVCHGASGKERIKGMPRLFGQKRHYLANQIKDILAGKRDNNYSQLMRMNYTSDAPSKGSRKKRLGEKEIEAIANFLKETSK